MIALIQELERKGLAYPADGDVYYAVDKFPEYGKLAKRKQVWIDIIGFTLFRAR